ncbi:MAG: glycosyl hydrolase-related protein [Chloroflexota bacterium]|nr:glycosyl hydrolase-related protein [Chloroflexota bacterium]
MTDLAAGREVLDGPGNQLWAYTDKPRGWDAWDVAESYPDEGEPITAVEAIEVAEDGPLRAAVRVRRTWRGSRVDQTYRLLAGSGRLDIVTELDWHERAVLLRARFPLAIHTHEATFETMYGVVRRPTHRNTSWDQARFEVSGHRFADLSEAGYGVALLNDAKYGFSVEGGVLGISLLRSPRYPDPYADEGPHRFTYSLFPHTGDWTTGGVVTEALSLNSPLVAVAVTGGGEATAPGDGPAAGSGQAGFVTLAAGLPLSLGSLKGAEDGDGLILRLHEPHGARGAVTLRFATAPASVEVVNLLEVPVDREDAAPDQSGDTVTLAVRPFEVVTLRLRF